MKRRKIQYNLENFISGRMSVVFDRRRSLESRRSPKPKVTGSSPAEDSVQEFRWGVKVDNRRIGINLCNRAWGILKPHPPALFLFSGKGGAL